MHLFISRCKSITSENYKSELREFTDYLAYLEYILRAELGTFDKEVAGKYPDITYKLNKLKSLVEGNDNL
jgi:hypothetical protein